MQEVSGSIPLTSTSKILVGIAEIRLEVEKDFVPIV
jgi:hypothetical protein